MLRADNKSAIRSAIGVGTTDAPTFLAQTLTGQSLTGVQATSLVDLAATWNTSGTPSAIKLNVVETGAGSNAASLLMDLQFGGVSRCKVSKAGNATFPIQVIAGATGNAGQTSGLVANGIYLSGGTIYGPSTQFVIAPGVGISQNAASYLAWGDGASAVGTIDTYLFRDGAPGVLAQRNGSAIQTLRIYNTYTDVNNFSRLKIGYEVANYAAFVIAGEQLGSGGGRNLALSGGGNVFGIGTAANGNFNWVINGGHLLAGTDNLHDIGAIGANRPRNIYAGSSLFTGSGIGVGIYHPTFGGLAFQSSGVVTVYGGAGYTTFDRLQIGGVSDLFPAIARDGAGIKITGAAAGSTSWIKVPAVAVSALPSASAAGVGARAFVNDALTPVFGSAVANGGAVTVPVYSTGSAWNVG